MITGFEKIVEERIRKAQEKGVFKNLQGAGQPLDLAEDNHIPEDLRLSYKILKNANCLPPEIEIKKEIHSTEALLAGMPDTASRYATLKKLNYLIMKLNMARQGNVQFDMQQKYMPELTDRLASQKNRIKS